MDEHRRLMMEAFKGRFVPALRERGFRGSFPHFRRRSQARADYLAVQFSSSGGRFVLEIGSTGPDGVDDGPWKDLPVEEIGPMHCVNRRRLHPRGEGLDDNWWVFGPGSTTERQPPRPREHYDAIADDALATFLAEGEAWFERPIEPEPRSGPSPRVKAPWPFGEGPFHRFYPWNRPRLRIACLADMSDLLLHRWENWSRVLPAMTALVERLPRPTNISSYQTAPGSEKALPFGRMRWSEANNRRWTTEYLEGPGAAEFNEASFWSPSRRSSIEQGEDPAFYARIQHLAGFGQSFVLALRLDQLPAAAAAADAVLDAVTALLPDAKLLICDRRWEERRVMGVVKENNLDDVGARSAMEWAEAHPRARVRSFAEAG